MMATISKMEYKQIKVTGLVSVERIDRLQQPCERVLLMGPTGAGKSSFVEAFGLKGSSKISSNGLNGCTQAVSTYKLNNVTRFGRPIYLVDSPGFADTKISEMAIVSMLQKWMRDNKSHFHRILYFTPITSVRLPGSQHRVLKTFHALTGVKTAGSVRIVTTMWDNIEGEHAVRRAVANYQQLQSDIWKDFVKEGAQMTPYNNTEESALSILDDAFSRGTNQPFSLHNHKNIVKGSPFEGNLLTDLQDRIQNIKSAIANHKSDLAQAEADGDVLLQSVVRPMLQEAMADLARFQKELKDSGLIPPPAPSPRRATPAPAAEPRGTSHVITHVQQSEDPVSAPPHDPQPALHGRQAVEVDITPKYSISTTPPLSSAPISQIGIVHSSIPQSDTQPHVPPTHSTAIPAARRSVVEAVPAAPQQLAPTERAPGRFARITELMKCWGDALGERHDS